MDEAGASEPAVFKRIVCGVGRHPGRLGSVRQAIHRAAREAESWPQLAGIGVNGSLESQ